MTFKERYEKLKDKPVQTPVISKEELKKDKELKKVFNQLVKQNNLNVGYAHTDIGQDNSFFMRKKDVEDTFKKASQRKGNLSKEDLKLITTMQEAKKHSPTGSIDDGIVMLGKGEHFGGTPETLAHELGHAQNHKEHRWLASTRHPAITASSAAMGGLLAHSGHPIAGIIGSGILNAPTLYDEGKASLRGLDNLEKLGYKTKKSQLAKGFASYTLPVVMPSTLYLAHQYNNDK